MPDGWDSMRIELHHLNEKKNFGMSRESFLVSCTDLNDHIVINSTGFRKAVSLDE